jgi:elongation factor 1-gamma
MATLYTFPQNPRAQRILIAAQYSGLAVKVAENFKLGETDKSPAFLAKFPLGKIPAFETADGQAIFETSAIAKFVASNNTVLATSSAFEEALVQQYVSLADEDVYQASCTWVYPTFGVIQYNKTATARAQESVKHILTALNSALETRTFLVGEKITLADITLATAFLQLFQQVLDPAFRAPFPHVTRWFTTLINQPQFIAVLGQVTLAEKQAQFNSEAFATLQKQGAKKDDKKEEKKPKEEKPKEEKPKEEKKPKKKDDDEEEPEEDYEEKAAKDPLAGLAPTTFVLDAFKRSYSNEDTPVAIDYFWKNFDASGYSIWTCKYKYPQELRLAFMSCNLITGMFQRIEKLRKHAFASVCVFGADNDNQIAGLWIWRGQELIFTLSEDWQVDFPSYEWTKLDPATEETKLMVKEYLLWEGEFKDVGKKFNQGKIFK